MTDQREFDQGYMLMRLRGICEQNFDDVGEMLEEAKSCGDEDRARELKVAATYLFCSAEQITNILDDPYASVDRLAVDAGNVHLGRRPRRFGLMIKRNGPASASRTASTNHQCSEYIAGLHRRHDATVNGRLRELECGCLDPWTCCHDADNSISDVRADAVIQAAETLLALGVPGIFSADECRAMWRRGRRDLSVRCYRFSHGGAA